MARKRDQEARRQQIIDTARATIARKGLAAVQLRDVAEAAELTPSAILYYYDDLNDMLLHVYAAATRRFSVEREQAIAGIDSPRHQLGALLRLSVPSGPDDAEVRLLYEFEARIFSQPGYLEHTRQFLQQQTDMFEKLLQHGASTGAFTLRESAHDTARNLIALEDSHGFSVLVGQLTPAEMLRLLYDAAATATGLSPTDLPPPPL